MAMLSRHAGCVFSAGRDAPVPLCGNLPRGISGGTSPEQVHPVAYSVAQPQGRSTVLLHGADSSTPQGKARDARCYRRPALPVPLCGILAIPTGDVRAGFATILDGVNTP